MQSEIAELMGKKDQLQARLNELQAKIKAIDDRQHLQKGLVDSEGFPRADLDFGELTNYRNLKKEKAELNNDHMAVMKQIEKKLFQLHQSFPDIDPAEHEVIPKEDPPKNFTKKPVNQQPKEQQKKSHNVDYLTPFARLTHVDNESPASKAGLKSGDLLSEFSQVTIYSIDFMKEIPKHVRQQVPIQVVVLRQVDDGKSGEGIFQLKDGKKYQKITVQVVPAYWSGRGMLGCKIDPLLE